MATLPVRLPDYRLPAWKRTLDLILGASLLLVASPLFLLCWAAVRLTSPGAALYWSPIRTSLASNPEAHFQELCASLRLEAGTTPAEAHEVG